MTEEQYIVATPDDFSPVVAAVLQQAARVIDGAAIVALSGDLGAGKTTFTQALAKTLGVLEPVVSPTFSIMKCYELVNHKHFDRLIHIDAYRIEDLSEIGPLRFQELFVQPRTLICIEWPENIENIENVLPHNRIALTITSGPNEERTVIMRQIGF